MARNLQSKLTPSDTVRLYDINKDAMEKLAQEMRANKTGGAAVRLSETAADAAKDAVCSQPLFYPLASTCHNMMILFIYT